MKSIKNIKNIIAVASGKGGVGKSTTSVNLALALAESGLAVGILDADIYGPNQPQLLGAPPARPETTPEGLLKPVICHGLQSMSIGYLVDTETAVVWRGPMVSGALQQLLNETAWQALDYLIIDLPPGTGDVQLTLAQKIPVTGAIIVTTPQDIALADVRRALAMFAKVLVPVLGVVENMSTHVCSQCGHEESIFGEGGGQRISQQFQIPLLGEIPLDAAICNTSDKGVPIMIEAPKSAIADSYRKIAGKVLETLTTNARSHVHKFPKIVIE